MNQDNWTISEILDELETRHFLREKLAFPRGILKILKETQLFGPMVEKALEDIDAVADRFQLRAEETEGSDADAFGV